MTYTFKLSRRLACGRAAGLAALLLLAGGCDSTRSFSPVSDDAPPSAVDMPQLAGASFAGGIPIGLTATPTEDFGSRYNGALRTIWPQYLIRELEGIKARGGKVILMLAGAEHHYKDANGNFSYSLWKARIDRYRDVNFSSYVTNGTIVGHYLIDEPNDPANWNGQPVSPAMVEQMAQYSKQLWPSMTTIVRAEPGYLRHDHRYLDVAWAQYVYRKGTASDYIRRNVTEAQARGLGLLTGLNVLKGGVNGGRMTASQVQEWGSTILGSTYICGFVSWKYDDGYLSSSGMGAAMDVLRSKAQNRATRSCARGTSDAPAPAPAPTPSPSPTPVAKALPFGPARLPSSEYSPRWTGSAVATDPSTVVSQLDRAKGSGLALIATLAPASRTRNTDGTFSLSRWKAQVDRYRTLSLGTYISGGTLYLHQLVEQPRCANCWGGKPIPWSTIEEMARYSKSIWPGLPTVVRTPPSTLAKSGVSWSALDAGWAQYSTARGDLRTFLAAEASHAKAAGLGLVVGLNLLNAGGPGTAPMTASQIRDLGTTMAREPAVCAMVGWTYDATYLGQSAIRDAMDAVAATAKGRAPGACVVN